MDPIAHLYRRAGFGATPAELAAGRQQGYAATLDQILNFDSVPDAAEAALAQFMPPLDLTKLSGIQAWWVIRMLTTSRPLVEKLTLFSHGHFDFRSVYATLLQNWLAVETSAILGAPFPVVDFI